MLAVVISIVEVVRLVGEMILQHWFGIQNKYLIIPSHFLSTLSTQRCNSKSSKGKSGKSYQTIDLCQKQAKTFTGQSLADNYEWAMADGSSSKGILSPTICSTNAPTVVPTTSGTNSPQQGTYSPTVTVSTYSPTILVSPPVSTFNVGSVAPTSQPTQKATTLAPTESPVSRPPSPMPLAAIVPPVNVEPQSTNFPTFGATPTVSTEVTGKYRFSHYPCHEND